MEILILIGIGIVWYINVCMDSCKNSIFTSNSRQDAIKSGCDWYMDRNGNMYHTKTGKRCTMINTNDGYELWDFNYNVLSVYKRKK